MQSGDDEFKDSIAALPDEEVQKVAAASEEEFRPEAIAFARQLLRQRGVPFQPPPPPPSAEPTTPRNVAKLIGLVVVLFFAAIGVSVTIRWYVSSRYFDPKAFMVVIALAWWGMVYAERGKRRGLASADATTRIRVIGNVVLAVLMSFVALVTCARQLPE